MDAGQLLGPEGRLSPSAMAEMLGALAYPVRLALLDALLDPKTLTEIRVSPQRISEGDNPARPAAMQTVAAHLEKLVETGFVTVRERKGAGKQLKTYALNPTRLYALTEELRRLGVRHTGRGLSPEATATTSIAQGKIDAKEARLVLVHGVQEGKSFPLRAGRGPWRIGRRADLEIALDYDPFLSGIHAQVLQASAGFRLEDLPTNKNGSYVNWRRMEPNSDLELRPGDVIGVGRSLLVFQGVD